VYDEQRKLAKTFAPERGSFATSSTVPPLLPTQLPGRISPGRSVCCVIAGNEPAAERVPIAFAIAKTTAVSVVAVAELIVASVIEAASPARVSPPALDAFLVPIGVGTPIELHDVVPAGRASVVSV
jgi:hypothetical protein